MDLRSEVERVAYEIYLEHGSLPGHEIEDWLAAEEIILSRLETDRQREEHIGKNLPVREMHVIEPTGDTVTS